MTNRLGYLPVYVDAASEYNFREVFFGVCTSFKAVKYHYWLLDILQETVSYFTFVKKVSYQKSIMKDYVGKDTIKKFKSEFAKFLVRGFIPELWSDEGEDEHSGDYANELFRKICKNELRKLWKKQDIIVDWKTLRYFCYYIFCLHSSLSHY
jgi:hypothetical protein